MPTTFTRGNPLHAVLYDFVCGRLEKTGLLEWRKVLVGDLSSEVLEIGAGTGLNLLHYPKGARVIASDFDPVMLRRAVRRADATAAEVEFLIADAQALPFDDYSIETLVAMCVLCSVPDPDAAVAEFRRVLARGGSLRFVEHVRDHDEWSRLARLQDFVNPAWRFVAGGCNCNRRTLERVVGAGFQMERVYRFKLGVSHVSPHVMAEATVR